MFTSPSQPAILFLSGASGAGKTTLAEQLYKNRSQSGLVWIHPDGFGVPLVAEMIQRFGSLENHQKMSTYHWIEKSLTDHPNASVVIIDSQSNLQFISDAFKHYQVQRGKAVLIHCEQKQREQRLFRERQQPELATREMQKWANFLHRQARKLKVPILNTSITPLQECITYLELEIDKLCSECDTA